MENAPTINTAQNVNIYFNIADTGKRIFGVLLDGLFLFVYIIIVALILIGISANSPEMLLNFDTNPIFAVIFITAIAIPCMFYNLLFPVFMQGQTPGKRIIGTRIVKEDGSEATFGTYLVRWLLDLVDNMFYSMVGLIVMLCTKKRQRVADLVAKTVVINTKISNDGQRPDFEQIAREYHPVFSQVLLLADNDVRIIRESFARAKRNQNAELMTKLREKIESVIAETKPEMTDEQYIITVLNDYKFFAEK
jgi:uncharacterized RDD family membrane protein YckC